MQKVGRALGAALIILATVGVGAPAPSRAAGEAYWTVVLHGVGSGSVYTLTSQNGTPDNQIDCRMVEGTVDPREVCGNQFYPTIGGTRYWYRVAPAANSCVQLGGTCGNGYTTYFDLTPGADITANVTFNHATWTLTVNAVSFGPGTGRVESTDGFFDCTGTCVHSYAGGTVVHLIAEPAVGDQFDGWTGACAGQDATCDLTMLANLSTTASFSEAVATPGPTPTATPLVTPHVTPAASTKASTGPTATPISTAKASASSGPGGPTAGTSADPGVTGGPSAGPSIDGGSLGPSAPSGTLGPPSPGGSGASGGPVSTPGSVDPAGAGGGTDLSGVVLAILAAGLFIAIAIGFVGFRLSRRGTGAPPSG